MISCHYGCCEKEPLNALDYLWQIILVLTLICVPNPKQCLVHKKKSDMFWLNWKKSPYLFWANNFFTKSWRSLHQHMHTHHSLPQFSLIISQPSWIALVRLSAAVGFLITLSACLKHLLAACFPPVFAIGRGGWMSDPAHHHIDNWTVV